MPLELNRKAKIQHPSVGIVDVRIKQFLSPTNLYSGEVIEIYGKRVKSRSEEQTLIHFMERGQVVNIFFKEENLIKYL